MPPSVAHTLRVVLDLEGMGEHARIQVNFEARRACRPPDDRPIRLALQAGST